jgi:lipopolysaccharide export system protein LptA
MFFAAAGQCQTSAQKPTKIKLISANDLKYSKQLGEKIQRLIGNVQLKHDSTLLFCDSAYLHELTNSFEGFGNVHIKASDTLNIFSDLLKYDGNSKMAELTNKVRLVENDATLYTEHLWYDRIRDIAYYLTGGKIVDSSNVLTSTRGYYHSASKKVFFNKDVVLVNDNYTMYSDTLMYNTNTETAWFYGPTTIASEENYIYCEKGWYDTRNDISKFWERPYIITKEQKLTGDTIYYDRNRDYGRARNRISLHDTIQNIIINGNIGEFRKASGYAYVTDEAIATLVDKKDSLFLHSDTLWVLFDSDQNAEYMLGYHHTKFFRTDLQGMCDSLVYDFKDSTIFLYHSPVIWSEVNQLTADTMWIAISNRQVDSLVLINSCFIVSMDDTLHRNTFNQIKGRAMTGYFKDNFLNKIVLTGNAESLYYVREENGDLFGINKTTSNDMRIYLSENEVQGITSVKNVEAQMLPEKDVPESDRRMKGFKWIEEKRPKKKSDILLW